MYPRCWLPRRSWRLEHNQCHSLLILSRHSSSLPSRLPHSIVATFPALIGLTFCPGRTSSRADSGFSKIVTVRQTTRRHEGGKKTPRRKSNAARRPTILDLRFSRRCYSYRRALVGFTPAARRAGIIAAMIATPATTMTTPRIVIGSAFETP